MIAGARTPVRSANHKAPAGADERVLDPSDLGVSCLDMTDSGRVVVVGAGLAGFRTAEELRARGFAGPITLIGAESWPPYDRPPLSKKVLTEPDLDPSLKADFATLGVDFRPQEVATGLRRGRSGHDRRHVPL